MTKEQDIGTYMYQLMVKLFPICRSITGDGVRKTLEIIANEIQLSVHEVPTGTEVFDWTVPKEWNICDAFICDSHGNKIIDFSENNLHVVGYSIPVDKWVTLSELNEHLFSLEEQPDAIPYITSYYDERWGFCISHSDREKLDDDLYHVYIDSSLEDGNLTYGECLIKGESEDEILISTYICHPSMANNELSGPVVASQIGRWLLERNRRYSYRIIFVPETIGSITYICSHFAHLKEKTVAGFNISCIGDERCFSYVASRYEDTLADKVAANILAYCTGSTKKYSFLDRGSDERQYCSPGVDLPLVTLSRSKFGTYPEYHTSLDNLELVTANGLTGGYNFVKHCIETIEHNRVYKTTCLCEPQLGKRNLYKYASNTKLDETASIIMNVLCYADDTNDLIDISNIIKVPTCKLIPIVELLSSQKLLSH